MKGWRHRRVTHIFVEFHATQLLHPQLAPSVLHGAFSLTEAPAATILSTGGRQPGSATVRARAEATARLTLARAAGVKVAEADSVFFAATRARVDIVAIDLVHHSFALPGVCRVHTRKRRPAVGFARDTIASTLVRRCYGFAVVVIRSIPVLAVALFACCHIQQRGRSHQDFKPVAVVSQTIWANNNAQMELRAQAAAS